LLTERGEQMQDEVRELAALSAHKVAAELNRRGIKSATGDWYPATVLRLRERLA
jgi:hypothetical protein